MPETRSMKDSVDYPFDHDNGWSDDIENVCEAIRHNAATMSDKHKKLYSYYKGQLKYYKIPVIIISGLNSVIAVGLQPYLEQGIISGSNCLLALLCGIIGSIELFLGIQTSMETELAASKHFYLLSVNIFKSLSLERHRRPHTGKEYLEEVYTEYSKLFENSALLNAKVVDKLATIPMVHIKGKYYPTVPSSPTKKPIFGTSSAPLELSIPSFSSMISGKDIIKRGTSTMIDPNVINALGQKNMISPDAIMQKGHDLLKSDIPVISNDVNNLLKATGQGLEDKIVDVSVTQMEEGVQQFIDNVIDDTRKQLETIVEQSHDDDDI